MDLDVLIARAARRDFQPVPTGITIRARAFGTTRQFASANVVGILPGRHVTRRNEAVVLAAHWDHLGIGIAEHGDSILNGAYDNASGVGALIEIARAFAILEPAPDRSIVFLATTGEEAGLLGATSYTRNAAFPLTRTAAALGIDGANLWGETFDMAAVGAERSTLGQLAEKTARDLELRLSPERAPERGTYYRSDHFAFARAGVPALLIDHGLEFRGRPPGWGARTLARYETDHYHRPSDDVAQIIDLDGALQQIRFAFLLACEIARSSALPQWLPGAEFATPRSR
jgi:Zn-dependent M28 family amino/carboxypeptidase